MHRIDGEGATVDNKFTEGNPSTGALATTVTADFMNALQEEIAAVIEGAGITLTKTQNNQLMQAIQSLIAGGGVSVTAAGVTIEDIGGFFTGSEVEAALQQIAEKIYAGTTNANQIRRSITYLSGTASQSAAAHAEGILITQSATPCTYTILPNSTVPFPDGTAIQICQGGAGKLEVLAGAGVSIVNGASFKPKTMERFATIVLIKEYSDRWILAGALEAA